MQQTPCVGLLRRVQLAHDDHKTRRLHDAPRSKNRLVGGPFGVRSHSGMAHPSWRKRHDARQGSQAGSEDRNFVARIYQRGRMTYGFPNLHCPQALQCSARIADVCASVSLTLGPRVANSRSTGGLSAILRIGPIKFFRHHSGPFFLRMTSLMSMAQNSPTAGSGKRVEGMSRPQFDVRHPPLDLHCSPYPQHRLPNYFSLPVSHRDGGLLREAA